jgi:CBS domain-containing protein
MVTCLRPFDDIKNGNCHDVFMQKGISLCMPQPPIRAELPLGECLLKDLFSDSMLSSPVVSIRETALVAEAASLLPRYLETFTDSLVAIRGEKPVGLVGGKEILCGVLKMPNSGFFYNNEVIDIMDSNLIVLEWQTRLSDLLNEWRKTKRAFSIIPNQYYGYSAISARNILEIGSTYMVDTKISEIPKKRIIFFRDDSTISEIMTSMFDNQSRKLVLENSDLFISDRIIIEKIARDLNCLCNTKNFLDMKAKVFKLGVTKRISGDMTISEASRVMLGMSSPYLITQDQIISPWYIAMTLDAKN